MKFAVLYIALSLAQLGFAQAVIDIDYSKYSVKVNEVFELTFQFQYPNQGESYRADVVFTGLSSPNDYVLLDSAKTYEVIVVDNQEMDNIEYMYSLYTTQSGSFTIDTLEVDIEGHHYFIIPTSVEVKNSTVPLNRYSEVSVDHYYGPAIFSLEDFEEEEEIDDDLFEEYLINGNWHYGGSKEVKTDSIFFSSEETAIFDFLDEEEVVLYKFSPLGDEDRKMLWRIKKGKIAVKEPAKDPSDDMKIWMTASKLLILERKIDKVKYWVGYYPKLGASSSD